MGEIEAFWHENGNFLTFFDFFVVPERSGIRQGLFFHININVLQLFSFNLKKI
jgi:hypothetical protein